MDIRKPKAIEVKVKDNLNLIKKSPTSPDVWTVAKEEYSHYDLYTTEKDENGHYAICEVKSRSKKYFDLPTLIIEKDKIDKMLEQKNIARSAGNILKLYLCCTNSRETNSKQFLYNVDEIVANGRITTIEANDQTYRGKDKSRYRNKITKTFWEFPTDSWIIELTTQTIGDCHSVTNH